MCTSSRIWASLSLICLGTWMPMGQAGADWAQDNGTVNINQTHNGVKPSIAVLGNTPYLAWVEDDGFYMNKKLYVKHHNGSGWIQDGGGSLNVNLNCNADEPCLRFVGNTPWVAWSQEDDTGTGQISVKRLVGGVWTSVGGSLNRNSFSYAFLPSLYVYNGTPFVAWGENSNVYAKYFDGASWIDLSDEINVNYGSASRGEIAVVNGTPLVAYSETDGSAFQLYVRSYSGGVWSALGSGSLNVNGTRTVFDRPTLAIDNGTPYVGWSESNAGQGVNYVKYFNGSDWLLLGGALNLNANQDAWGSPRMVFDSGTLYAAWTEADSVTSQYHVNVKYYNGSQWTQLGGSLNINADTWALDHDIAALPSKPYAVWRENDGAAYQIFMKHYDFPTSTTTPTATRTRTRTVSATPTFSPSVTGTSMPSGTRTGTATASVTGTGSVTATVTSTGTRTPSFTVTPVFTSTVTPTSSATASVTGTSTGTRTGTATASVTGTGSVTATVTLTGTRTPSFTVTPVFTATATPTASVTASVTRTSTVTRTVSASVTATVSATRSMTRTVSPTFTVTRTITATPDQTQAPTPAVTRKATWTATRTVAGSTPSQTAAGSLPENLVLAFPNPASTEVRFTWNAPGNEMARLEVFNMNGELVTVLRPNQGGAVQIRWDASRTAPGIYLYRAVVLENGAEKVMDFKKVAIFRESK